MRILEPLTSPCQMDENLSPGQPEKKNGVMSLFDMFASSSTKYLRAVNKSLVVLRRLSITSFSE